MNPNDNSSNHTQQYNGNIQPVQPDTGYPPQGNIQPSQQPSNQTPDAQAGYEWLASYDNQSTQPQKGDSLGKKLLFITGVVIIIVICSLLMVFSLGKSNKQAGIPHDTASTQSTDQPQDQSSGQTEADTRRQNMLKTLQGRLEEYHSVFGYYPTFDNITNPEWLKKYNVTDKEISDPDGGQPIVKSIPSTNHFSYQPIPEGCNNATSKCTGYTIATVLSNADIIELKNR